MNAYMTKSHDHCCNNKTFGHEEIKTVLWYSHSINSPSTCSISCKYYGQRFSLSRIIICVKVTLLLYSFYIVFMYLQHFIHAWYTAKLNLLQFIYLLELFIPDISYVDKLLFFVNFDLYISTLYLLFADNAYLLTLLWHWP